VPRRSDDAARPPQESDEDFFLANLLKAQLKPKKHNASFTHHFGTDLNGRGRLRGNN
jgi:hypothetical protein